MFLRKNFTTTFRDGLMTTAVEKSLFTPCGFTTLRSHFKYNVLSSATVPQFFLPAKHFSLSSSNPRIHLRFRHPTFRPIALVWKRKKALICGDVVDMVFTSVFYICFVFSRGSKAAFDQIAGCQSLERSTNLKTWTRFQTRHYPKRQELRYAVNQDKTSARPRGNLDTLVSEVRSFGRDMRNVRLPIESDDRRSA